MIGAFRAMLAWFVACYVGVCVGLFCMNAKAFMTDASTLSSWQEALEESFSLDFVASIIMAPLSHMLVLVMRATGIRRPWADTVGGAVIAMLGSIIPSLVFCGHLMEEQLLPFALIGGLVAGPVYWRLAGMPRPPYNWG